MLLSRVGWRKLNVMEVKRDDRKPRVYEEHSFKARDDFN